jgi:hypothetical protein
LQIPVLVEICSPLCVCNCCIVSRFPTNHIAGLSGMQYLVPMHLTVFSPNCFGAMVGAIATVTPAAAASLRREVAASNHFGELVGCC